MWELGVGRTTFRSCLAGKGNPSADTIELLVKGMNISPAQLVAGEIMPADGSVNVIGGMVDTLHPSLSRHPRRFSRTLCASCSLSPIHLDEALKDFLTTL